MYIFHYFDRYIYIIYQHGSALCKIIFLPFFKKYTFSRREDIGIILYVYPTIPIYLCIMLVLKVTYYTFTWIFAVRKIVSVIGLVACKNGIKMNENGARQESQRSQKTVRTP